MQLSPSTPSPAPSIPVTGAPNGNPGPIGGVSTFGTLQVAHRMGRLSYFTEHRLLSPIMRPFATPTGSLDDAIRSVQEQLRATEAADARTAVAITMGVDGAWIAHQLLRDADLVGAIDAGVGHDGIASMQFVDRSRSLVAVVTSRGTFTPGA